MNKKIYIIEQLKFEQILAGRIGSEGYYNSHQFTVFGYKSWYEINPIEDYKKYEVKFIAYYGTKHPVIGSCNTLDEAKQVCQEHYENELKKLLIEVR